MFVIDDWFRSTRRVERTVKFSTTTTKRILMSKWFAYKMQNCSKTDTLKNKKWCRFVYVQIIAWMMLSIVMCKVWIDWFRNYGRQSANLCTVTASQLPGHHPFSMGWRQDPCQMPCKNIRPNSRPPNLALRHNRCRENKYDHLSDFWFRRVDEKPEPYDASATRPETMMCQDYWIFRVREVTAAPGSPPLAA